MKNTSDFHLFGILYTCAIMIVHGVPQSKLLGSQTNRFVDFFCCKHKLFVPRHSSECSFAFLALKVLREGSAESEQMEVYEAHPGEPTARHATDSQLAAMKIVFVQTNTVCFHVFS